MKTDQNHDWAALADSETRIARRLFLGRMGTGIGSVALAWLCQQSAARAGQIPGHPHAANPLSPKQPHFPARAKSCIFLMMEGGVSQVDTFDPKPELRKVAGTLFKRNDSLVSNQTRGNRFFVPSPFSFEKYGRCGMPVSDLLPHLATCVDEMAFVRSVYGDSDNHPAALFQFLTGKPVQGNPSIGAWTVYGLGSENQNLPAFVVMRDGRPYGGTATWGNGYLPSCFQGTQFRSGRHPVVDLRPPEGVTSRRQRRELALLSRFNREFGERHPYHPDLTARIANYELAYRMQSAIPEAVDLKREPETLRERYGLNQNATEKFGARCLLARRLVERGVRFVQIWSGGWDSHQDIKNGHRRAAERVDRPIAALIHDLKDRGLLEETLVVWGGEFGRTPDTNATNHKKNKPGRDHNPGAMTMWFAGGGVQGGTVVGETDAMGNKVVEKPYHLRDVHATFLHLFGLDQWKLKVYHGGRFKQLTDTGGTLIRDLLA